MNEAAGFATEAADAIGIVLLPLPKIVCMQELEGEGLKEMITNCLQQLREWLKPDPADNLLVTSLKMVYKAFAVLLLIAFSPVILIILVFVFVATI